MNNIIEKLAEEATIQTQLKMIMDYPSFESQLYQEDVNSALDKHFGIDTNE